MELEWNTEYCKKFGCFFNEIIEIGAVKLDENFNIKDSASVIVKPQIGKKLRGRVKDLTHITNEDISSGISFEEAVKGFSEWLGDEENTFLTWGDGDIRVFSKNYEYFFNIDALPFIDNYVDAQKYCQSFIDAPSGQQIGLASACEKLGVNPEDFSHHRALDDSLMTVECIRKVYDSAKLQKYIRKCDTAFYKKLSFKPYVIKDLNDPDIDRSKLKCVCDTCGGKVVKKKKWGFVNNSFRAEFYCPNCDKNFRVSVRYKRYFDRVEAKKTFSDIAQKDRHRSKQKEKA